MAESDDDTSLADILTEEETSISELRMRDEYSDPYKEVDTDVLPDWWQAAIQQFRENDLRPYQPPRFTDGAVVKETVDDLEGEFGVSIDFIGIGATYGDDWTIRLDREPIGDIPYHRDPAGYTVYGIESDAFAELVRSEAKGRKLPDDSSHWQSDADEAK